MDVYIITVFVIFTEENKQEITNSHSKEKKNGSIKMNHSKGTENINEMIDY
jgi:hypothetical protein